MRIRFDIDPGDQHISAVSVSEVPGMPHLFLEEGPFDDVMLVIDRILVNHTERMRFFERLQPDEERWVRVSGVVTVVGLSEARLDELSRNQVAGGPHHVVFHHVLGLQTMEVLGDAELAQLTSPE